MSQIGNENSRNRIQTYRNENIRQYLKKELPICYFIIYAIIICMLSLIQLSLQITVLVKFSTLASKNNLIIVMSNYVSFIFLKLI